MSALDAQTDAPDEALLARAAQGDRLAARILTERLAPLAYRVGMRMTGNRADAEEIAQEAMLRLWRGAGDWQQGRARLSTWLYRVAMNLALDGLRRKAPLPLDSVAEPADHRGGAEEELQDAARARALEAALLRLPERQRQAVVLRHLEGLANPRIAEIMELGVEAVESLTARGKRALARELAALRPELGYGDD